MTRRTKWIVVGACAIVLLGSGAFLLYRVFGGTAPPEVALATSNPPSGSIEPTVTASASAADDSFEGTWVVDTESGSFEDFTSSFAGYRIEEELGGIGANTAVGRTPDVSGTLQIEGTVIADVSVTVDMTTLVSDEDRRDSALRDRGLETASFPTATFELAEPIEVGSPPQAGGTIEAEAVGDLTLHGVTNRVTVPIEARWTGEQVEVVASFDVALVDYDIEPPVGFLVLSVADEGTIELHLLFARAPA